MSHESSPVRNLLDELASLVNSGQSLSDIHLEQDMPMMIRTPRGWSQAGAAPVTLEDMAPVLGAIDKDWEARIAERAIDRPFALPGYRLRCNVYRSCGGARVTVAIRCLPALPLPLAQTGLPQHARTMLDATHGVIMVTGPTRAGKTTTVAAMLDHINATRNAHIVTIEEPIEYRLEHKLSIVSQKEVPTDTATFSSGLREALRQNPDVLMVGEIRDVDTADTVLYAGDAGHLVLATMHASSAVGALTRLLDFFPAEQRDRRAAGLARSLVGVIFQSLVQNERGDALVLAHEILFNTNQQLARFIADPGKVHQIEDVLRCREDTMSRSLNDVLAQLVAGKTIAARDAMRAAYNRHELHDMLARIR